MKVTDFGAILVSLMVPDENHKLRDVVLGYDTVEGYYENPPHFGSPIGRNGNRIGNASFTIDGVTYQLEKNDNGKNNLHSGPNFYRTRVWDVAEIDAEKNSITYRHFVGYEGSVGVYTICVTKRRRSRNLVVGANRMVFGGCGRPCLLLEMQKTAIALFFNRKYGKMMQKVYGPLVEA